MTFDFPGYDLRFIQKTPCRDGSAHLHTEIYKFLSPVTKYHYIVRAEYYECDCYAIKFYCQKDKHSDFKYSRIVNKGDMGNILMSCAKLVPQLLKERPTASFGFGAARSVDTSNKTIEDYGLTQRFKTYKYIATAKFGTATFEHYEYPQISCYLLVNRLSNHDIVVKEQELVKMFSATYPSLPTTY